MAHWSEEYSTLIEDCQDRQDRLTEWECNFLDSLFDWVVDDKMPTPKQIETLDRIWEKATAKG